MTPSTIVVVTVVGLSLAVVQGVIARSKGRSFIGYYLLGVPLWLVSVILVVALPALEQSATRPCPKCRTLMNKGATACVRCGHTFPTTMSFPPPAPTGGGDYLDQLARLSDMKDRGALTEDEFAAMKAKLLG